MWDASRATSSLFSPMSTHPQPQAVRRNAATLKVENVEFLFCPRERHVRVNVPIKLTNTDASVGVRKGGWLLTHK